jgi:hypothetical protein
MAEEIHHPDGRIDHPSVRHEHSDASFGWVLGLIIGAVILGVIIHYSVGAFLDHSVTTTAAMRGSRFPLAGGPSKALPPEPRLEQLNRLSGSAGSNAHAREETRLAVLNSLGPTREMGFAHIPIDRAMRLLADTLPARGADASAMGITGAGTFGLLSGPAGQGPLLAASVLFPGNGRMIASNLRRRDNGLVNGGASNSGRLFKTRGER